MADAPVYRFGPYRLDAAAYRLYRGDELVALSPKLVDLLLYFVERPSVLVSKEDLFARLWPDVTVTDNALAQAISDLRRALDDEAASPRYVQTVARRGYRFIAPVIVEARRAAAQPGGRRGVRETANLDAYRAFTEGRLKLETLDVETVRLAVADFERAIAGDPDYALAYSGLAAAQFLLYEASCRAQNLPDQRLLAAAIASARRAVDLDPDLAEAHAMLAFALVAADRPTEALNCGRRAVALEPGDWRHQFRLGHAAWGEERLQALGRALELYPDIAFAHLEIAMVRIARSELALAEAALREGILVLDRPRRGAWRFPACGLHWLLGMILLRRGALDEAIAEFDTELRWTDPSGIYGCEFAMNAHDGLGFARLARGEREAALEAFGRALSVVPGARPGVLGARHGAADAGRSEPRAGRGPLGDRRAAPRRTPYRSRSDGGGREGRGGPSGRRPGGARALPAGCAAGLSRLDDPDRPPVRRTARLAAVRAGGREAGRAGAVAMKRKM